MEITNSSWPVFYASRLFGFAPYKIHQNRAGRIVKIRHSKSLGVYSVTIVSSLVILCVYGLTSDAMSSRPLRMKSSTAKICTALDVNVVAGTCLLGMISGWFGLRHTQEMNRRLNKADDTLSLYIGDVQKSDKLCQRLVVYVTFAILMSMLIGLDIHGWHREARKQEKKHGIDFVGKLYWYFPFYALYILMVVLQIQFAQAALGLGRRYRLLNVALMNLCTRDQVFLLTKAIAIQTIAGKTADVQLMKQKTAQQNNETINRFASIHESLGKSMVCISSAFGLPLLVLMSSCLLHLVVTAYFFVLQLLGERDTLLVWLQSLWLGFHFLRLLLIVEPCHFTSIESSRTLRIVCKLMRLRQRPVTLKSFWQQLLADESYFSACGICRIDRRLLTTLSAAIATYLVILLQFEMADNDEFRKSISSGTGSSSSINDTVARIGMTSTPSTTSAMSPVVPTL